MGSTITPADMKVIIQEQLELNGVTYSQNIEHTISDVAKVAKRVYNLQTAADHTIFEAATAPTNDKFDNDDVKYIRITNLDDTNAITLTLIGGSNGAAGIKLEAGQSLCLLSNHVGGAAGEAAVTPDEITKILCTTTAETDVEVMVALV